MKAIPRKVRDAIEDYVRRRLSRREEIELEELNQHLIEKCEVEFVDDELLCDLIIQAKKEIGFVYLKKRENEFDLLPVMWE